VGRYPFERRNVVDVLHAVIHDEPPMPRSIDASIPRALEAVILKCMRKERSRRYQSMDEIIAELDAWLDGRPVESESSEWFSRLVGVTPRAPSSDTDLFQTVGMEITRDIAEWDANLYRVSRNLSRFYPMLDTIIERLDTIIEDNPHFAWARFYRGVARFRRVDLDAALDDMERTIDRLADQAMAQFEMGRLYLALYLREHQRAHKHYSREGIEQHLVEARGRLRQAVVCFEETRRLKRDLQPWQFDYAAAVGRLGDQDSAGCVEACDRILETDSDLDDVWKLRGDALRFSGGDPFESYDRAIEIRRSHYDAHVAKAEAYLERGQVDEARPCLLDALDIHPDCSTAAAFLAQSYLMESRGLRHGATVDQIRSLLEEGLGHTARAMGCDPKHYEAVATRAELLTERARIAPNEEDLTAAVALATTAETLDGCRNRAQLLRARALVDRAALRRADRPADAREDLVEAIRIAESAMAHLSNARMWTEIHAGARRGLDELEAEVA